LLFKVAWNSLLIHRCFCLPDIMIGAAFASYASSWNLCGMSSNCVQNFRNQNTYTHSNFMLEVEEKKLKQQPALAGKVGAWAQVILGSPCPTYSTFAFHLVPITSLSPGLSRPDE
jgi:hypothetical protein